MGLFFLINSKGDELKTSLSILNALCGCVFDVLDFRLVKSNFHVYSSALEHVCLACPDNDMNT